VSDEIIPLGEAVIPRVEKAMPADFPDEPFLGLDDIEAHTTRRLGSKPSVSMKSAAKRFYTGDVLYSRLRPYLNKVWLADRSGLCSSEFIVLPSNAEVDGAFLKYRLSAMDFVSFANSLNAGDRPRVDFDQIGSFHLPPFSISYQKRIVTKIDKLFSELEAGEESLRVARRQLDVYRQSLLKQAFEGHLTAKWRTQNPAKLEAPTKIIARIQSARQIYYAEQLNDCEAAVQVWESAGQKGKRPTKPNEPATFAPRELEALNAPQGWAVEQIGNCPVDTLIGLVRSADVQHTGPAGFSYIKMDRVDLLGNVDLEADVFVDCTPYEVARFSLRKGDILFNTRNSVELVGKVGIIRRDPETPAVYNNNLMRLRLPDCLDPLFVGLQLCAQPFRQRMERVKKATTSVAAVYGKDFWPLPLVLCSLPEQQEIVRLLGAQFEVIERNEQEIDGALRKSEALRQAILKKAFTGRLVLQDPSDEPTSALLARLRSNASPAKAAPAKARRQNTG
jgi:type I restriction enzyme S subunit